MEKRILRDGKQVTVMCRPKCAGRVCECERDKMKRAYLSLPGKARKEVRQKSIALMKQNFDPHFRGKRYNGRLKRLFYHFLKKPFLGNESWARVLKGISDIIDYVSLPY